MSSTSTIWYSFWSSEKLHKLSRSRDSHLQLIKMSQPGFPFWVSPTTPVYIKPSLLTPEFVKFLIPSAYRSPQMAASGIRAPTKTGNQPIFNGSLDTSPSRPPFSPEC